MEKKFILGFLFLFSLLSVSAQTVHNDYFVGKWDVMVYATPSGDERMIIELKRVNGKLAGAIVGPTDDVKPFKKIEETPSSVKLYFRHLIFTVNLMLQKKDDIHCTGFLQGKYKANGVRMK